MLKNLAQCPAHDRYTKHEFFSSSFYFFLIEAQWTYNVILVSGDSDLIFLMIILHLKLLENIGYIPCAVQSILVSYLFYTQQFVPLNPLPLFCPSPHFVLCISEFVSVLLYSFI